MIWGFILVRMNNLILEIYAWSNWPEKNPITLASTHFEIQLEIIDEQTRLIRYRKHAW